MRIVIAVCISLICSMAFIPAWAKVSPTVEEDIRVDERNFRLVFGGHKFFPGQKITIQVQQTIDAHHEYWEVRECSWFGAKCWYEPRESATIVNTSTFPVLLSVKDSQGKELNSLEQTIDTAVSDSPVKHVPLPQKWEAPQTVPLGLDIQDSGTEWKVFGAPIQVFARIADRGAGNIPLHYNSCDGRPRHCGRGSYRITVLEIDNTERMKKLEALLQSQAPPSTVISALKQDRFLVSDPDFRVKLARLLFNQSQKHTNPDAQQEYLQFALEIDRSEDSVEISNALSKAYLDSGNIQSAKDENGKTFQVIAGQYTSAKDNKKLTVEIISEYYKALKMAAKIGSVERGGIYSGDLIKATGVYIQASEVAGKGRCLSGVGRMGEGESTCLPPVEQDKKKEWNLLTQMAYEAGVDASRLLMMMRSHENMEQAERLLVDAVTLAQQLVTN